MATLIEKLEHITSTEDDDYFSTEYKLDLLNRAKNHIIELGITSERRGGVSLRYLDDLRVTQSLSFNTFTSYESFYKTTISKPSDIQDWIFLDLDGVNLSELNSLFEIKHGNAIPDPEEGYFLVYDGNFELYLDSDSYSSFILRYVKTASTIQESDTSLDDLGEGAERAVLYHAATLMADGDVTLPSQLFQDQLNKYIRDLLQ